MSISTTKLAREAPYFIDTMVVQTDDPDLVVATACTLAHLQWWYSPTLTFLDFIPIASWPVGEPTYHSHLYWENNKPIWRIVEHTPHAYRVEVHFYDPATPWVLIQRR